MITAAEAKLRAQNSKEQVGKFLEILGKEIETLAEQGKFEYEYHGGKSFDPVSTDKLYGAPYASMPVPEFWKLVEEALKAPPNYFRVKIEKSAPYIPRGGLGCMDDEPQEEQVHLSMKISW